MYLFFCFKDRYIVNISFEVTILHSCFHFYKKGLQTCTNTLCPLYSNGATTVYMVHGASKCQQMLFLLLDYGNECQWKLGLLCKSLISKSVTYMHAVFVFEGSATQSTIYWPNYIFNLNIGLFIKKIMNYKIYCI